MSAPVMGHLKAAGSCLFAICTEGRLPLSLAAQEHKEGQRAFVRCTNIFPENIFHNGLYASTFVPQPSNFNL